MLQASCTGDLASSPCIWNALFLWIQPGISLLWYYPSLCLLSHCLLNAVTVRASGFVVMEPWQLTLLLSCFAELWSPGSCNDITERSACSQWWELRSSQLLCTESQIHHNGPALWRVQLANTWVVKYKTCFPSFQMGNVFLLFLSVFSSRLRTI